MRLAVSFPIRLPLQGQPHWLPLLGSMVGGAVGPEYLPLSHGEKSGPFSGQQIVSNSTTLKFPTFFLIKRVSTSGETFHSVSPFLVERAITGIIGDVKSTKKLQSGDLLVEVQSRKQSEQIVKLKTFSNILITVSPHATLNSSKGVTTCGELLNVPTEEILKELQGQGKKKSFSAPSVQQNRDASAVTCSKPSDSTAKATPPITNLSIPSSPSVAPASEEALASPDFTDFQLVRNIKKLKKDSPTKTNHSITKAENIAKFYTTSHREITNPIPEKDSISTYQSALKPIETTKHTSVDIELLPMAVLPPLEKRILQSRESDADAEMSSSSAS
ncbi:hypothetical protein AVEN_47727-1 [Araneus ventricosus]|uniref:Uncharacterized protein n=1 Tax=Araneus ventricosus TaxID=182803 RepID=A0A4Y2Q028_ARAVE|nr:hypothetical protein AVEN_47727-1 [Araneus ventricosus]